MWACCGLVWACGWRVIFQSMVPLQGSLPLYARPVHSLAVLSCCAAVSPATETAGKANQAVRAFVHVPPSYPEPSQVGRLVGEAGHLFSCILQRPLQLHFWSSVQNSDDAQGINLPCDGVLVGHVGHVPYRSGQLEFHVYTDICRSQLCSTPLTLCTPHSSTSQPIQPG